MVNDILLGKSIIYYFLLDFIVFSVDNTMVQ